MIFLAIVFIVAPLHKTSSIKRIFLACLLGISTISNNFVAFSILLQIPWIFFCGLLPGKTFVLTVMKGIVLNVFLSFFSIYSLKLIFLQTLLGITMIVSMV